MIHPVLQNSSLGPAEIKVSTDAHEECLCILKISDRLRPLSELIAARVIAIAKTGVRDPKVIAAQAIRTLGIPRIESSRLQQGSEQFSSDSFASTVQSSFRYAWGSAMLAEQNDPVFHTFGAEVYPRCPQCGLLMHDSGRGPSVVLGDTYECERFACECKFEMVRSSDNERHSTE
jgi:hypothetical protein